MVQFGAQFFVGFLHLHTRKDKGDDGIHHKRKDEGQDIKLLDAGVRLNSQGAVESAGAGAGSEPHPRERDLPGRDSDRHVCERRAGGSGVASRADAERAAGNAGGYRAGNGVFGRRAVYHRAGFGR